MKNTKKTRRVAAFAAAVMMAACVAVPMSSFSASAVDYTITVSDEPTSGYSGDEADHTYEAYQIFKAESVDGKTLKVITWGDGITPTDAFFAELAAISTKFAKSVTIPDSETTVQAAYNTWIAVAGNEGKTVEDWYNSNDISPENKSKIVVTPYSANEAVANTIATALSTARDDSDEAQAFAAAVGNILNSNKKITVDSGNTKVGAGYYLIQDAEGSPEAGDNAGAKTRYILKVANDITINPKSGVPSVIKKVKEDDKTPTESATVGQYTVPTNYNDVADYSIGEMVPFQLIGSVPNAIGDYKTYYYEFTDTLSKGFVVPTDESKYEVVIHTYDASNVETKYKLTNDAFVGKFDTAYGSNASVSDNAQYVDGKVLSIKIEDLKNVKNYYTWDATLNDNKGGWSETATDAETPIKIDAKTIVTVDYEAKLDTDAVIGLNGNENKVSLTYSRNPNYTGTGAATPEEDKGKTPEDKVIVFTYEIDIDKTNAVIGSDTTLEAFTAAKLKGAEFMLYRKGADGKVYAAKLTDNNIDSWIEGTFTETTTGAAFDAAGGTDVPTPLKSDDGTNYTTMKIVGIDDTNSDTTYTYYIKETKVPDGYNKLKEDVQLTLTATTANNQSWAGTPSTALTGLVFNTTNAIATDDSLERNPDAINTGLGWTAIVNSSGAELPSTGGIGTTLFYVGGGVLVAGAGVLLITKKRAKKDAE